MNSLGDGSIRGDSVVVSGVLMVEERGGGGLFPYSNGGLGTESNLCP